MNKLDCVLFRVDEGDTTTHYTNDPNPLGCLKPILDKTKELRGDGKSHLLTLFSKNGDVLLEITMEPTGGSA
jgi:hypothetical protein